MEDVLKEVALAVALAAEAVAVCTIFLGILQASISLVKYALNPRDHGTRKRIWLTLAMWLVLALEFELAADIVRGVIAPSWVDIGQLAAIGAIRTFLNFFLERDLEKYAETAVAPGPRAVQQIAS